VLQSDGYPPFGFDGLQIPKQFYFQIGLRLFLQITLQLHGHLPQRALLKPRRPEGALRIGIKPVTAGPHDRGRHIPEQTCFPVRFQIFLLLLFGALRSGGCDGMLFLQITLQQRNHPVQADLLKLPHPFSVENGASQVGIGAVTAGPQDHGRQPFSLRNGILAGQPEFSGYGNRRQVRIRIRNHFNKKTVIRFELNVVRRVPFHRFAQVNDFAVAAVELVSIQDDGEDFCLVRIRCFQGVPARPNQVLYGHAYGIGIVPRFGDLSADGNAFPF